MYYYSVQIYSLKILFFLILQLRPGHQRYPRKSFRDGSGYTLIAELHKSQTFIFGTLSPTLSNRRKLQVKIKVHLHKSQRPQGPVLISAFQGKQPSGDVCHNPRSRLPLLSARPAVTFPVSERQYPWSVPSYSTHTAW